MSLLLDDFSFADLENEDFDFFKGLEYLLEHDVSELGYDVTFSTEVLFPFLITTFSSCKSGITIFFVFI